MELKKEKNEGNKYEVSDRQRKKKGRMGGIGSNDR